MFILFYENQVECILFRRYWDTKIAYLLVYSYTLIRLLCDLNSALSTYFAADFTFI